MLSVRIRMKTEHAERSQKEDKVKQEKQNLISLSRYPLSLHQNVSDHLHESGTSKAGRGKLISESDSLDVKTELDNFEILQEMMISHT